MGKSFLFFSAQYLPTMGGVERYTDNLARKLVCAGNRVTVVTSQVDGQPETETADGIRVIRLPGFRLLGGRFPVPRYGKAFRRLIRQLEADHFDLAVIQTRFYLLSAFGAGFARRQGIPSIAIEHGTNHFTVGSPALDWIGQVYEHGISFLVSRSCHHFYGVSQACCDWLSHFHIHAEGKLYNSVNPCEIQEKLSASTESYREALHLGESVIVSYAGRLVPEKGIRKLVEAMDRLHHAGVPVKLLVAGDGPLLENLKARQHPDITFLGKLDFDHVIALLKDTDIFCLPTDYPEGFPTSVLEAAACRCYIVTTTRGGSKELISDESFGSILESNTAAEIANAIARAASDSVYRTAAAERAYQRLCERFTWDRTSAEVLEIAEKLAK
ncbi:MAG: glycosyltransferase family 4 protein [Faecousia sp.]